MRRRVVLVAVLVVLAGVASIYGPRALAFLRIATTFSAQQVCACVHVGGRTLQSCTAELGKAGELLHIDAEADTVRTSALFGLFSGEARNEAPYGCHPVK